MNETDMKAHSKLTMMHNHHLPENQPNYNNRVAVVTGSSSGIGFETALLISEWIPYLCFYA
jgi:hypothetical protein